MSCNQDSLCDVVCEFVLEFRGSPCNSDTITLQLSWFFISYRGYYVGFCLQASSGNSGDSATTLLPVRCEPLGIEVLSSPLSSRLRLMYRYRGDFCLCVILVSSGSWGLVIPECMFLFLSLLVLFVAAAAASVVDVLLTYNRI